MRLTLHQADIKLAVLQEHDILYPLMYNQIWWYTHNIWCTVIIRYEYQHGGPNQNDKSSMVDFFDRHWRKFPLVPPDTPLFLYTICIPTLQ